MDFIPGVDGEGIPRVLACFMHALMTGAPLQLVDGGRQRRSFLDVGEFVDGVERMLDRPQACSGRDLQPRQPAQRLHHPRARPRARGGLPEAATARSRRRGSRRSPPRRSTEPGTTTPRSRIPSVAKAARLLGWRPRRTLAEMLPAIVGRLSGALRGDCRRPAPASPRQPAGAGDEAGRRRAGLQRRPPPAGRGRAHRRPTAPPGLERIIIVDDGSADDTAAVADALARDDAVAAARAAAAQRRLRRGDEGRPRRGAGCRRRSRRDHPRRRAVQPGGAGRAPRARSSSAASISCRARGSPAAAPARAGCPATRSPATGRSTSSSAACSALPLTDFHSGYLRLRPARARRAAVRAAERQLRLRPGGDRRRARARPRRRGSAHPHPLRRRDLVPQPGHLRAARAAGAVALQAGRRMPSERRSGRRAAVALVAAVASAVWRWARSPAPPGRPRSPGGASGAAGAATRADVETVNTGYRRTTVADARAARSAVRRGRASTSPRTTRTS